MTDNINTLLQNINYARRRNLKEKRSESEKKANANLMNEYLREINTLRKPKPLSAAAAEWNPPASTLSAAAPEWNPPRQRKQSRKSRKSRKTRKLSRR